MEHYACQYCCCQIPKPMLARKLDRRGKRFGQKVNLFDALGKTENGLKLIQIIWKLLVRYPKLKAVYQPCPLLPDEPLILAIKGKITVTCKDDLLVCRPLIRKIGYECAGGADEQDAHIVIWFLEGDGNQQPQVKVKTKGNLHLDESQPASGHLQISWTEQWSQKGDTCGIELVEDIQYELSQHLHKDAPTSTWYDSRSYKNDVSFGGKPEYLYDRILPSNSNGWSSYLQ